MHKLLKATMIAGAVLAPAAAMAQGYPDRTVTLVIPWSAGGSNDTIGRYLADGLSERWGVPVVVDQRPGAGGNIGAAHVVQSEPDGYTILFTSGALTSGPAIVPDLLFDPVADLQPSGVVALGDRVAVASTDISSMQQLAEMAEGETVFYGTSGLGGSAHFDTLRLSEAMGIQTQMEPVHYQGGTDALLDVAGGRVSLYLGSATQVLPSVEGGLVNALAVLSDERSPALPDVPTIAEAGYPGAESYIWWATFVPAGTPGEVVAEISSGIDAVMHTPETEEFLARLGARPANISVAEFETQVADEVQMFIDLADEYGLSSQE